ncbi:MAG: chorismate mutase [Eubacteriaceae bacterium]
MNKLECLRSEIDKIDTRLIELFERRMDISQEIAEYKKNNCIPIFDEEREREVLEKNIEKAKKHRVYVSEFMNCIMIISKKIQKVLFEKEN